MPLCTEAPRKTALVRAARGASEATVPGRFSTGKDSPVEACFADEKIFGRDDEPVGRNQVAGRKHDDVAGHDRARRHDLLPTIAEHAAGQCKPAFELLDRGGRAVLLGEAKECASEQDGDDDACVDPFPQRQRNGRPENENEDERTGELPKEKPYRAQRTCAVDAVRAEATKPFGGLGRRQAFRARSEGRSPVRQRHDTRTGHRVWSCHAPPRQSDDRSSPAASW